MAIKKVIKGQHTQLPKSLEAIRLATKFTPEEILDFHKKFNKMAHKEKGTIGVREFKVFMKMMCINSPNALVEKIFEVADQDKDGDLSFSEFMKYFNVVMRGDDKEKADFCFLLICRENKQNAGKRISRKFFRLEDLYHLLLAVKQADTNKHGEVDYSSDEDSEEGVDDLYKVAESLFQRLEPS